VVYIFFRTKKFIKLTSPQQKGEKQVHKTMSLPLEKIIPLFLLFALGYFLKKQALLEKSHADLFLKLVMYVAYPALIIPSFATLPLSIGLLYLPVIAGAIMVVLFCIAYVVGKQLLLSRQTMGTFLLSAMIMNLGFMLSFFLAVAEKTDVAYFLLFNMGHDIVLFTFVYWIACKHGANEYTPKQMAKKIFLLPPLWAIAAGLLLNWTQTPLPGVLTATFSLLGSIVVPLMMLALGAYFSWTIKQLPLVLTSISLRMIGGGFLGFLFVSLFSLEGMVRFVVLLCSIAPVGFNTLVFSSLEKLDKEFAAQVVSLALLIGLGTTTLFLYFL
jgi:hypothetical protein